MWCRQRRKTVSQHPQWTEEEHEKEMEELSFKPSAVSKPRLHLCDNKCREEGFKYYQLVATVTEGGKDRTINLSKQCFNERRLKHGERAVTVSGGGRWSSRRPSEAKWHHLGSIWRGISTCAQCDNVSPSWTRSVLADAEKERRNGTDCGRQQETPS